MFNSKNISIPAILLATTLGASSGLYIKSLPFSGLGMTGFRMGVPFLFLLPMILKRKLLFGPADNRRMIWTGSLLNAIRMVLYILSYKLTTLTNAVVLLYTWPLFALLIHSIRSGKKLNFKETGLLLTAFTGVITLNIHKGFSLNGSDMRGNLFMILSALIFSISTLIFKEALVDHSEGEVLYFQNALGAVLFIPILLIEIPGMPLTSILTGIFYGFSVGIVGFGCFFIALKRLPIFQYGALGYMEVFTGVLFGILLLGEEIRWNILLGASLILITSFLSRMIPQEVSTDKV
ncbi:DMT family transporter [Oceanispirochaeta crateris]|uniref:DMT family transporter n=1 Tax=Oceanispirochaeta crateris TaxID=2518645 RepID=A0A5C1QQB1_9SPIO|nr:DMT family transporter [Oceanispirochaeta crateris]QEN08804.1 DMT family transporter [Oceanispirochaeta crateris]